MAQALLELGCNVHLIRTSVWKRLHQPNEASSFLRCCFPGILVHPALVVTMSTGKQIHKLFISKSSKPQFPSKSHSRKLLFSKPMSRLVIFTSTRRNKRSYHKMQFSCLSSPEKQRNAVYDSSAHPQPCNVSIAFNPREKPDAQLTTQSLESISSLI